MDTKELVGGLLSLPTETLVHILGYLPAYDKLCVRVTCKRLHSIVSDPRVWDCLVWRDCRRSDRDFVALRLALRLARQHVRQVVISYPTTQGTFPLSKFLPQVHSCKELRSLTLTGMPITRSTLEKALFQLPALKCLTITPNIKLAHREILVATSCMEQLTHLCLQDCPDYLDVVDSWKHCDYQPPNLCVYDPDIVPRIHIIGSFTSSDHPTFLTIYTTASGNMVHKYPFLEVTLHPSVQIVACNSQSICTLNTSSLVLTKGKSDQYTGVTYCKTITSSLVPPYTPSMLYLPTSIQYVCLAHLFPISSKELTLLSESCPNLVCLNIDDCVMALRDLLGLADIGTNCSRLTSLSLRGIDEVESATALWEILVRMTKLQNLALDQSFCTTQASKKKSAQCIHASASQLRLLTFAVESNYHQWLCNKLLPLQLDLLLPAFRLLQHLQITNFDVYLDLTDILPGFPSLTSLRISCSCHGTLTLPADPVCYSSLKKIYVKSERSNFPTKNMHLFPKKLTHLYLNLQFHPCFTADLSRFPNLCECYICRASFSVSKTDMKNFGICGQVLHHRPRSMRKLSGLQPLWAHED